MFPKRMNKMNKTRVLFIFGPPPSNQQKNKMNKTRALFILALNMLFLEGENVPQKNEQSEQNAGFVQFCFPIEWTRRTK